MQIKIPHHNANATLSDIRTIDLIKAIFALSKCSPYVRNGLDHTKIFLGEISLNVGRIHIKAQVMDGHYVIDVHFDSERHKKKPNRITYGDSFVLVECPEVIAFVNEFVIPIILKNRTNYHYRLKADDPWRWHNALIGEKK
jgi:hypothetical protein